MLIIILYICIFTDKQQIPESIIDHYLKNVSVRERKHPNWPNIFVFDTKFYPLLKERTQAKDRNVEDLTSFDLVLIPVLTINSSQWILVGIYIRKRIICLYHVKQLDEKEKMEIGEHLQSYLKNMSKSNDSSRNYETFTIMDTDNICKDRSQDYSDVDSGVFVCVGAEILSRDSNEKYEQKDVTYYRHRMMYEIMVKKFVSSDF